MKFCINSRLSLLSCTLISNECKVVDKPLGAGLTLFIVIILLTKMYIDLPATIKKIKTYQHTTYTCIVYVLLVSKLLVDQTLQIRHVTIDKKIKCTFFNIH